MSKDGDYILLKWGTLKGWKLSKPESVDLLRKYFEFPVCASAALQKDAPEQQQLLLDLIRSHDGQIHNDWDGNEYTQEQAIDYVMNYGKEKV